LPDIFLTLETQYFSESHILYEDNHLIAVNKLPGQIVQGDKTGDKPLSEMVAAYIKEKYKKPGDAFIGVTHRIDRPVSGVVLFARTSKALTRINEMFRDKKMQKTYWALVEGFPPDTDGKIEGFLWKNEKQNKSYLSPTAKKDALKSMPSKLKKVYASHWILLLASTAMVDH
jgi:23S rRNA pseudouridine1911/1915/1917 synthase